MAYRDETEALRARVEQLERENAELRREGDALRVARADAGSGERGLVERVFGGPLVASAERTIEGELPASAHEPVLELLRETYGALGEAQVIGGTLTWRLTSSGQRWIEVIVSAREGRTRVRITEHLGGLAALYFGGVVGGAGVGGSGALVPLLRALESPWSVGLVPLWLAGTYAVARAGYRRGARRRGAELGALGDRVAELVEREVGRAGPRVRVADPAEGHLAEPRAEAAAADDQVTEGPARVAAGRDARTSKA